MRRWRFPAFFGLAISTFAAHAHHSISGIYDTSQQVRVVGVVTEFRLIQPHAVLMLNASPETNAPEIWQLEMDNHYELVQIGIDADTFKPGDQVIVNGNPGRTKTRQLYLRQLDRPADGLRYEQVGYRPRVSEIPEIDANE